LIVALSSGYPVVHGRIGEEGTAVPVEGGGAAERQNGVCLTTVGWLCKKPVKREELAVQQLRR